LSHKTASCAIVRKNINNCAMVACDDEVSVGDEQTRLKTRLSYSTQDLTALNFRVPILSPLINGTGYSGAILSDMPTFLSYVEYMLFYHVWCHDLHLLPIELQQDYDLIDFGSNDAHAVP
jgi:hypothetical protein